MDLNELRQSAKDVCSKWKVVEDIRGSNGEEDTIYFNESQNAWITYDFKQQEKIEKYKLIGKELWSS